MSYQHMAQIYDYLMRDAPYQAWLDYVQRICTTYQHMPKKVLDLACGTGAITIPLAKQGLDVIGVDLSADMLAVAHAKSLDAGVTIQWLEQDMSQLTLLQEVDTILCFCDSLNYLIEEELLKQTFQKVYNHLSEGGLFLFDVHSIYQVEHGYGEHTFTLNEEEIAYIWQCYYNQRDHTVIHELSFFVQETNDRYVRYDEVHMQRAYPLDKLTSYLELVGFEVLEITADFTVEVPKEDSRRWFIAAKK